MFNEYRRAMPAHTKTADTILALSMGDPAGIGPDITLQAWAARDTAALMPFVFLGDPDLLGQRSGELGMSIPIEVVENADAVADVFLRALPVFPIKLPQTITPGVPDPSCAPAVVEAIKTGVEWVLQGRAAAFVTNPINKKLLTEAGFHHPGHTEYLAELCAKAETVPHPVMMLSCGDLRVVPVTVHIPLKDVPVALSQSLIVETVQITARGMRDLFKITAPSIGVTGLNPHAGEEGTLGREEIEIITPAIQKLSAEGFDIHGPLPADAAFQERERGRFDVLIAMYHDQALIPIKTLAFDRTVNLTLGLPIVRTSPDHGTAYELAGTGKANPGSLIESLQLAAKLSSPEMAAT
jgi:4-hydroxythreonine-4-phosphate dehydrogenase